MYINFTHRFPFRKKLEEEMKRLKNIDIIERQLPSPSEVMEASYNRVLRLCEGTEDAGSDTLVQYFADKLSKDIRLETGTNGIETMLVHRLASAMAALSGLDRVVPARSLLTADPRGRTVRVFRNDSVNPLSPSEVTTLVKSLGSGKLGRISICKDGSAVFDLGSKRALALLENAANDPNIDDDGWHFELPSSLPPM